MNPPRPLREYRAMSFDCYGTLIDWQAGILSALRPILRTTPDARIIAAFAEHERRIEAGPYLPYHEVLRRVAQAMLGPASPPGIAESLPDSLTSWRPFAETNPALSRLARHFPLAIASNVDNDLFDATRAHITIPLAPVVTAEQVRSYKPAEPHFRELARRLGLPTRDILHIAESRYHDIEPAGRLGFGTVWINRAGDAPSASGTGAGNPLWTFNSLSSLADAVEAG